jgi:hypothetical protein
MSERPLPKSWSDRIRERLAEAAKLHPEKQIRVVPKGPRASGPHLGERWHSPVGQAELQADDDKLLDQKRCAGCGCRVIIATGALIEGLWCGLCNRTRVSDDPPSAA